MGGKKSEVLISEGTQPRWGNARVSRLVKVDFLHSQPNQGYVVQRPLMLLIPPMNATEEH
jgi:hypothetical protein